MKSSRNSKRSAWLPSQSTPPRSALTFKRTFIVSVSGDEEGTSETWIGMVGVLGPSEIIPAILEQFERAGVGADWNMYVVVGMWVHPEHRGRGLGTRLMEAGLEWVRTNMDPKNNAGGKRDKMVLLQVGDHNASGCALYQKVGFMDIL